MSNTVANGLIERMDIEDGTEGSSTAFSRS